MVLPALSPDSLGRLRFALRGWRPRLHSYALFLVDSVSAVVCLVLFVVVLRYFDGLQCFSRFLLVEVCVNFVCVELICVVELWFLFPCGVVVVVGLFV